MTRHQQEEILEEWQALRSRLSAYAAERVADAGDMIRLAELDLSAADLGRPSSTHSAVQRDYGWALEAYQASGKLLDEAVDLPDLAAAVVLAERAVERFARAQARLRGQRPKAPASRCFYNPLHGSAHHSGPSGSAAKSKRRRSSPRQALANQRPACESCQLAILAGRLPDVLPALLPVKTSWRRTVQVLVPYYMVPRRRSPWSTTTCGAYDDGVPGLITRGEHRVPGSAVHR